MNLSIKPSPEIDSSPVFVNTDIKPENWLFRVLPNWLKPYAVLARWDRPIGTWLLLLPTWWGLALANRVTATDWLILLKYGFLVAIGAIALRGAGCTINDMVDYKFDKMVERTSVRPLASDALNHLQAFGFLMVQIIIGCLVLSFFPLQVWVVAILSLPLIIIYPFMKRITWYPQAWLGLTFNWGVWLGYFCLIEFGENGENLRLPLLLSPLLLSPLLLYSAGFWWTMGYDMIYAHQDKEDDRKIGVKSTALRFEKHSRFWAFCFYALMIIFLILLGFYAINTIFWWIGLAIITIIAIIQVKRVRFDDPQSCLQAFKQSRWLGFLILGLLFVA